MAAPSAEAHPPARAHRKRGDGEGTLYQDHQRGLWIGELMVGSRADGRKDIRKVSARTHAECRRKLQHLRQQHDQGTLPGRRAAATVDAFLDRWFAASAATVRPRTHQRYAEVLRLHARPTLGRIVLARLRPDDLQALYARKLAEGQAPASVRKLHAVLHRALADAVRWNDLPRNVADAVDSPAVRRRELRPPTADELVRLLAAEPEPRWQTLWTLAAYSGARQGELLALQWADLDLDAGVMRIRRTLQGVRAGVPSFGEPKTARSRRTVTLDTAARDVLRAHRALQLETRLLLGPDYADLDLVFASATGTPLMARNVHRAFKLALGRAGLPASVRFHDLRHAHATLLLQAGRHPKVVADRLGHSTVTLTLDTYSHAVPGLDAEAATCIGTLLGAARERLGQPADAGR